MYAYGVDYIFSNFGLMFRKKLQRVWMKLFVYLVICMAVYYLYNIF